jgi:hypothetical protein
VVHTPHRGIRSESQVASLAYSYSPNVRKHGAQCRLGPEYVAALRERGFHAVYVQDGIADDVEPIGIISERLRVASVRNVQTLYELMSEATQDERDQVAKEGAHVPPEVPLDIGEGITPTTTTPSSTPSTWRSTAWCLAADWRWTAPI